MTGPLDGFSLRGKRLAQLAGLVCLAATATLIYFIDTGSGKATAATTPSISELYPALNSTGPTGLTPSAAFAAAATIGADGPTWRLEPGSDGPNFPIPSTIRRLPTTAPAVASWISQSGEGGICVTISPNRSADGRYPKGSTCTEPAANSQGTFETYYYPTGGNVAMAGIEPTGVSSVQVAFSDGTTRAVPVVENGWALESASVPVSLTPLPGGSTITIQGG